LHCKLRYRHRTLSGLQEMVQPILSRLFDAAHVDFSKAYVDVAYEDTPAPPATSR